jgi:predicted TIM-barrel fold metal-dependent hydrolase
MREHPSRIAGYVAVNPNDEAHAAASIERWLGAGMIGIKLAASRRANDPQVDHVAELARQHGVPILHHIWQHRRREWPGQEASDAMELLELSRRHPAVPLILAHIGGGGDWNHSLQAVTSRDNIFVDMSGSGVDGGMLEAAIRWIGVDRLLWGCDLTMCTGLAKLRFLSRILPAADQEKIAWRNAVGIFPSGALGGL